MKDKDEDEEWGWRWRVRMKSEDVRREGTFGARKHWHIYHVCIIGSNLIWMSQIEHIETAHTQTPTPASRVISVRISSFASCNTVRLFISVCGGCLWRGKCDTSLLSQVWNWEIWLEGWLGTEERWKKREIIFEAATRRGTVRSNSGICWFADIGDLLKQAIFEMRGDLCLLLGTSLFRVRVHSTLKGRSISTNRAVRGTEEQKNKVGGDNSYICALSGLTDILSFV